MWILLGEEICFHVVRGVRFFTFFCGAQTSTVQRGWGKEWAPGQAEMWWWEILKLSQLSCSCGSPVWKDRLLGFSSSYFIANQKPPGVLDKVKTRGKNVFLCPLMTYPSLYHPTVQGHGLQTSAGSGQQHLFSPLVTCYFLFPNVWTDPW